MNLAGSLGKRVGGIDMCYYINGCPTFERYFWQVIGTVAGETERQRLLDGLKVYINGTEFFIDVKRL